jgi:hypothetical protein
MTPVPSHRSRPESGGAERAKDDDAWEQAQAVDLLEPSE